MHPDFQKLIQNWQDAIKSSTKYLVESTYLPEHVGEGSEQNAEEFSEWYANADEESLIDLARMDERKQCLKELLEVLNHHSY